MRRAERAIKALFQRKAAGNAAANMERRKRPRPPAMWRCPLCFPLSSSKGARLARAAASSRLMRPSSGMGMMSARAVRSPIPGMLSTRSSLLARISMGTKALGKVAYLRGLACRQSLDVAVNKAPKAGLIDMFEPGLEARDVLLDLFEEGQISSQIGQSRIRRDPRLFDGGGTGGNQFGIEGIVLGPAQMYPAERLDLDRLQHLHREAARTPAPPHIAFITAGSLDTDPGNASLGQVGCQNTPARKRISDLPAFGAIVNRDIELCLGRIDSCRRCVSLCHLPRPCLVKRTKLFRQPSGSDEGTGAITLRGSQNCS